MTNKKFIIQYILLKILASEFVLDDKLPSENSIAKKFKCSRITARTAYSHLESIGLIAAQKGVGYHVKKNADQFLWSLGDLACKSDVKITKVNDANIKVQFTFNEEWSLYRLDYYDKENSGKLVASSYWSTTPLEDEAIDEKIIKTLFKPLAETGAIIQKIEEQVSFKVFPEFNKVSNQLGYCNNVYPVSSTLISTDNDVPIAKIVAIANKEKFIFSRKTYMSIFD